jgi:hypothetical protein
LGFGVAPSAGVSYSWSLPGTGTIQSGQGSSAILSTWGTTAGNVSVKAANACGLSSARTKSVVLNACRMEVGNAPVPDIRIFPNPGRGRFFLEAENLSGSMEIRVYNTMGVLVFQSEEANSLDQKEINLENLPAGMYMVKVKSEGFTSDLKMVKQ